MNRKRTPIALRVLIVVAAAAGAALAVGYGLGRSSHRRAAPAAGGAAAPAAAAEAAADATAGKPMLQLSDHALAMASVETTPVTRRDLSRELRTVGKVQYNESALATVTARVDGYAERLFVNFTGVEIKSGDHLAEVYSPDLLVAQQELLIALEGGRDSGPLVETAKLKLRRWGVTEAQVRELVAKKEVAGRVTLYSPISGTVIEKGVVENSAFKAGDILYRVANLDTVWVYLDVYEYDLAWVRFGQRVEVTAEALPGRAFSGMVTFIQPVLNEETRTVRVPVHVENEDHALKPGMFVSAVVKTRLSENGRPGPTGVEGKYSCVMHPRVLRGGPGKCPVCEMPLKRIPGEPPPAAAAAQAPHDGGRDEHAGRGAAGREPLAVPATAVLDSGTRRIVYVERSRGLFEPRELVVGPRSGDFFPVLDGLKEGDRVVTRGGFLIDSQFQITGRPSLFYPGGLAAGSAGHRHGGTAPGDVGGATSGGGQSQHKH
jgi:Cu(I)/Ag(I) efflux system membrane fusion protein